MSATAAALQMQLQAKEKEYSEYTEQTSEIRSRVGHMQTENLRLNQTITNMGSVTADLQKRNEELQNNLHAEKEAHELHIQTLTIQFSDDVATANKAIEEVCHTVAITISLCG